MIGPNNIDKLKDSINRLYKRYMVQVMNTPIFRKSLDHSNSITQQSFNGTAIALVSRLTVDFTSKLVLQIMLATMLVLEAISLSQIKLRGLLPRSPCSIASVMALLAGGTICHSNFTLQKGEPMSQKDLREIFCQQRFGMGWWHESESTLSQNTETHEKSSWFGIDVGEPDRFGFNLKEKISRRK
ncbi:hypothetical protein F4680DRAFT_426859 [Xylaria scruposa]|nr:hypothetical protein F4680DRAFT_426859 [Xylaria scruposa]